MALSGRSKDESLPGVLPVFPLMGALLLPRGEMPLNIFEPRYLRMVRDVMGGDRMIGMVQPVDEGQEGDPALYGIGCAGRICSFVETEDGRFLITLKGVTRFKIVEELSSMTPYRQVKADYAPYEGDRLTPMPDAGIARADLIDRLTKFLDRRGLSAEWSAIEKAPDELLINSLAMICPFSPAEKQALLEAKSLRARTRTMISLMEFALADPLLDEDDQQPPVPN
ncbi:ATP-dependent protease [Iodidimonas gelatinilytica]|uniref:ATP-dependent protease n=1 Tax=Iodidimonas gelatinilytica TaxID=1236966 RepID=A0A5A7N2I4_9PROT|nr:LON peptidase substrate-binding domain-containing protein [Iodidimonas gelatinilytica]GER01580.1 ATP-dependent protease [Iodidimonas gelatinilytica]